MKKTPVLRTAAASLLAFFAISFGGLVHAQVYNGGGLPEGVGVATSIKGPIKQPLRETVIKVLVYVLNFLALAAVIVIIIAGIRLLVSQGEEEQITKARKTILWALAGLIVVLFAKVIVKGTLDIFS